MNRDIGYSQDDRTILVNQQGQRPTHEPLTDFARPPRYEDLEERMIYASSRRAEEHFNVSINPLVAAAAPLLSAIIELKARAAEMPLKELKATLTDHLKRFEAKVLDDGMEHGQVMVARYLLCTVIDEAVVTTRWGEEGDWSSISLLSSFHNETFGGEKFFQLLESMGRNPMKYLATLELMYICLSLGFEGKFRVQARGNVELDSIRDGLYRQIRQLRGDVPRELSPHWTGLAGPRGGLVRVVPWWLVAAFTAICLLVMYSGFSYVLGEKRETVLHRYQPAEPAVIETRS